MFGQRRRTRVSSSDTVRQMQVTLPLSFASVRWWGFRQPVVISWLELIRCNFGKAQDQLCFPSRRDLTDTHTVCFRQITCWRMLGCYRFRLARLKPTLEDLGTDSIARQEIPFIRRCSIVIISLRPRCHVLEAAISKQILHDAMSNMQSVLFFGSQFQTPNVMGSP